MRKRKKINKVKISIIFAIAILILTGVVFGEYVFYKLQDRYLASKSFYFTSDLLDSNTPSYSYANWSGIGTLEIPISLYSYNNELLKMEEDMNYEITCTGFGSNGSKINCSVKDGATGIIRGTKTEGGDNTAKKIINVNVKSGQTLKPNDKVQIRITAKGTNHYSKTISAEFTYTITQGEEYEIEDSVGNEYAIFKLKNTTLSEANVTLEFDPTKLRLDLNNDIYSSEATVVNQAINGANYVKSITFKITGESSKNIRFYKVDKTQNYQYPSGAAASAITCKFANTN